ncbi:WD40 repeat-containing protein [Cynara cardunculus var. scolymus]|uniref:WD40 repeat-containing protein n=1 Tax=Cynara cardunculus var. scolymus TaxID=59895 RepID=A0A103YB67_CYNCS|nr:WD40 repeat-containing protein [Cynara cardunculus var. scolymus]
MKERGGKGGGQPSVNERYTQWKSLVPILYDWLANHNLTDGSVPNTLVIANCEIVKPRVAAAEHIAQFNEEARSPFVKKFKTIIHPGEVNRIRELPQNSKIVATHTDSPDVLIWDVEAQPNRHAVLGATESRPDLILTGHQEDAEFALAMCQSEPFVLSGGKDKSVVLWSIHDHISTLATDSGATKSPGSNGGKSPKADEKPTESPKIQARGIFQGHEDTVEDVQSADNTVRLFDRRNLTSNGVGSPVHIFTNHNAAVLCVQWSPDKSSIFGSSAEDGVLNIWDHNKIGERSGPASKFAPGLLFRHSGHRYKIWRMIDLIHRPQEEVINELEKFKSHILTCSSP